MLDQVSTWEGILFWIATRGKNMKSILLTSTAMVMVAGIAAADGHASMTWSGTATAGIARAGNGEKAIAAVATIATGAQYAAFTGLGLGGMATVTATAFAAGTRATAAEFTAARAAGLNTLITYRNSAAYQTDTALVRNAAETAAVVALAQLNEFEGTVAVAAPDAGNFREYAELNAAVVGTVAAGGLTLSAQLSVDAGDGYDFADDDEFDNRTAGSVGLDTISVDMGTAGKVSLNDNGITHLVDGDDDEAADVLYTNTFGVASFSAALDLDKGDLDTISSAAGADTFATAVVGFVAATASTAEIKAVAVNDVVAGAAAVLPDVQWSAKVSMPVGSGSVYVAMDEESGNAFGGSALVSGMTLSIDSKLEALGADLKSNRQNTLGVAMTMGAINGKFTYDSIKDGNQWGVSAGYTAGDMSVAFATNEASSWEVTGGYALGAGASVKAGVNYTEDAFLGLSFAF
jgi:hypothetical protein